MYRSVKVDVKAKLRAKGVTFNEVGTHIYLACVFCGRQNKMYFNVAKQIGDCKVCDKTVRLQDLFGHFGIQIGDPSAPDVRSLRERFMKLKELRSDHKFDTNEPPEMELPEHKQIHPLTKSWKYIHDRGLCGYEIEKYGLVEGLHGKWEQRLIIPIRGLSGVIVGYQGRALPSYSWLAHQTRRKYRFPLGFPRAHAIFGAYENRDQESVVMTEGAIPAMTYDGIASFGKALTAGQLYILLRMKRLERITLLWDRDAWGAGEGKGIFKAIDMLTEFFKVRAIMMPEVVGKNQPDDFEIEEVVQWISDAWKQDLTIFQAR